MRCCHQWLHLHCIGDLGAHSVRFSMGTMALIEFFLLHVPFLPQFLCWSHCYRVLIATIATLWIKGIPSAREHLFCLALQLLSADKLYQEISHTCPYPRSRSALVTVVKVHMFCITNTLSVRQLILIRISWLGDHDAVPLRHPALDASQGGEEAQEKGWESFQKTSRCECRCTNLSGARSADTRECTAAAMGAVVRVLVLQPWWRWSRTASHHQSGLMGYKSRLEQLHPVAYAQSAFGCIDPAPGR